MALAPELEENSILKSIGVLERTKGYKSVGEISRLWFNEYEQVQEALAIPEVANAAAKLAIGLLRKDRKSTRLKSRHDQNS